jgi:hypothetical protein
MSTRESRATKDPAPEQSAQTASSIVTDPPDIPRCDFAGVYCGALGWHQREAAGRARLCCRSYLHGFGEEGE